MKKFLTLIAIISFNLSACERHPASHLAEGADSKGEAAKPGESKTTESTPEPSPSGTPKRYFPRNSQ